MSARPNLTTWSFSLVCVGAVVARLLSSPPAFYLFFTRPYNPFLTWSFQQSDLLQLVSSLHSWLWVWLPGTGLAVLALFVCLLQVPEEPPPPDGRGCSSGKPMGAG